ncbi:G1 family glutamic endopeptidase [Catenulispora subtropica]|uniref:Uncharacterized protein n=1 Tax=Catenulispora subtropica TaxID=450798 RepID=A0ABN2SQG3_9ACTN
MARRPSLRRVFIAAVLAAATAIPALATPANAAVRPSWTTGSAAGCGATAQVVAPTATADPSDNAMSPARRSLLKQIKASGVRMLTSASCRDRGPGHPAPARRSAAGRSTAAPDGTAHPDTVYSETSNNWSGFENYDSVSYTQVTMAWTVPTANAPAPAEYHAAIWPGIGSGDSSSSALIQDGTDSDAYCNAAGCTRHYDFWYEVYPAESSKTVSGLSVKAGDKVQTSVIYDPSNKSVLFFFVNATTQKGLSITQSVSGLGDKVDQSQVEWIVERPSVSGTLTALTNFGTMTFSQTQYTDSSYPDWVPGGYAGAESQITMTNCKDTQNLAVPYGWTSDLLTWYDVWVNAGKWESC